MHPAPACPKFVVEGWRGVRRRSSDDQQRKGSSKKRSMDGDGQTEPSRPFMLGSTGLQCLSPLVPRAGGGKQQSLTLSAAAAQIFAANIELRRDRGNRGSGSEFG